jgi:hypothetical protein
MEVSVRLRTMASLVAVGAALVSLVGIKSNLLNGRERDSERRLERRRVARSGEHRRTLRERFQEEREQTARGDGLRGEEIGERDLFQLWFFEQRSYPGDQIPANAIGTAFAAASRNNSDAGDPIDGSTWFPIGPSRIPNGQTDSSASPPTARVFSPVSGRVSAIAPVPRNRNQVYVGGAQGGVWKLLNAQLPNPQWIPLTDHQASLAVGSITVDPVNTNIVYVGTGEANRSCDSYYGRGVLRSTTGGLTWTLLGGSGGTVNNPGPFVGKAVSKIVIDPATAGSATSTTLWAATTLGFFSSGTIAACDTPSGVPFGLWRSNDSGVTWQLQSVPNPGFGGSSIHDIVLDPTNHDVLYVAVRNNGVWKTTNATAPSPTFTRLSAGFPVGSAATPIRRISLTIGGPGAPTTVYAAIENGSGSRLFGLYKSTDGLTWSHVDAGFNGMASVTAGDRIVNWVSGPKFVTDGTWNGRRLVVNGQFSLSISTVLSDSQLRLTANYPGPTSAGAAWSTGNYPVYCDGQCFYDMTLAADPSDPMGASVYVGGNPHSFRPDQSGVPGGHSLWRTDDGGLTWRSISQGDGVSGGVHTDDHAIAFDGTGFVFDGNDGGIWRSGNRGASWTSLNTNLAITQFQGVSTHPQNPAIVLGGTQDNGTNILNTSLQPPPFWFHSDGGDGGQSLIDQSRPATMFHTYFNASFDFMGPARNDTGGTGGWDFAGCYYGYGVQYYNGMDPKDPVSFYAPLAQHPGFAPNVVYFGSNKVYRSANPRPATEMVASWTPVSPPLTKGGGAFLSWIGVFPNLVTGKEVLYTGASDGRIEASSSVDGTGIATWSVIDAPPLPNRAVTGIYVLGNDPTGNSACVTFSGFNVVTPTTPGHVFCTKDGLSAAPTWTDISGDLPDLPANAIVVDESNGDILIGSDIGVFRSRDGGQHWKLLSRGLPFVAVFGLERNRTTGQIVASTHGRGMFQLVPNGIQLLGGTPQPQPQAQALNMVQ